MEFHPLPALSLPLGSHNRTCTVTWLPGWDVSCAEVALVISLGEVQPACQGTMLLLAVLGAGRPLGTLRPKHFSKATSSSRAKGT